MAFDLANAQRLGLGNTTIGAPSHAGGPKSFTDFLANPAAATAVLQKPLVQTQSPLSPITKAPVGAFASSPTPSPTVSSPQVDTNYFLQPGESQSAYNNRIAAYHGSGGAFPTSTGGLLGSNNGNATASTNFTIDTNGTIGSDALGSGLTRSDVTGARKSYADYIQQLSQASQYSPDYLVAQQAVNQNKLRGAELTSNFYTGSHLPGDTLGYAQGFTSRESALNDLKGLGAAQNLQTQQLARTGDIEAAKALVQGTAPNTVSPGSSLVNPATGETAFGGTGAYSDYQAQQTYFNLAQSFPDAQIPAYNPQGSAQQNLQLAQQLAASSPSFQSRNLVQVQLPGGGISFVNRNQMVTGADGSISIVSPAQAAQAEGYQSAIKQLTDQRAQIGTAINTADANFPLLLNVVRKAGINDFNAPIANKLQQAVNKGVIGSGDYASFIALQNSLQSTYSQILSRGYAPTESVRKEADGLINGTLGYKALSQLYETLKAESNNIVKGIDSEKNRNVNGLSKVYNQGQSLGSFSGSTGGSSKYSF